MFVASLVREAVNRKTPSLDISYYSPKAIFYSCLYSNFLLESSSSLHQQRLIVVEPYNFNMTSTDLDVLLDMGFDKERASIAVKKSGGRKILPPSSCII